MAVFALTATDAGSDEGAMAMTAAVQADGSYVLNGVKTWISYGGKADFYVVFAKTNPAGGTNGISAFSMNATTTGLDAAEHLPVMSPHPLATL